jgi:hypothetical protein
MSLAVPHKSVNRPVGAFPFRYPNAHSETVKGEQLVQNTSDETV